MWCRIRNLLWPKPWIQYFLSSRGTFLTSCVHKKFKSEFVLNPVYKYFFLFIKVHFPLGVFTQMTKMQLPKICELGQTQMQYFKSISNVHFPYHVFTQMTKFQLPKISKLDPNPGCSISFISSYISHILC